MRSLLSAVALLVAVGLCPADDPKAPAKPTAKKDEKQTYKSKEGKFSVVFPVAGKVTQSERKERLPGGETTVRLADAEKGEDPVYMVSFDELADDAEKIADIDAALDGSVSGMLKGVNGKEKSTSKMKVQGAKGREMVFDLFEGEGAGKARAFLVGTRPGQVLALSTGKEVPAADDFLQSLTFTDLPKDKKEEKKDDKPADKKDDKPADKKDDKPADKKDDKLVAGKQKYTSKEGKYSVEFPFTNKVKEFNQEVPTDAGKLKLFMVGVESGSVGYLASYSDYPEKLLEESDPETILDGVVTGVLKGKKETETKRIKIQGLKGRETTFEMPELKAYGKARMVLVGNRLYQVFVLETDAKAAGIDSFLKSFTLTDVKEKDDE